MIFEKLIPKHKFPALKDRIDAENKRAKKLGVPGIQLQILSEETKVIKRNRVEEIQEWYSVKISGESPKYEGWTFIASLKKDVAVKNHLLCSVPGETVPLKYRRELDQQQCDHCHVRRNRNKIYIVRHDNGHHKQVGSTCVKDFTGGVSPEWIASLFAFYEDLEKLESEFDDYMGGGFRVDPVWTQKCFLETGVRVIKEFGWTPRSRANEFHQATSDIIVDCLIPKKDSKFEDERIAFLQKISDSDKEKTQKILEWLPGFFEKENLSDYEWNLKNCVETGKVSCKTAGLVASIIPLYDREMGVTYQKKDKKESEHIGEIKEKIQIKVKPVFEKFIEGDYGTTHMIKFEDESGNSLVWFASREQDLEMNEWYQMKAAIKAHNQYNGKKETVVTRAKLEKIE